MRRNSASRLRFRPRHPLAFRLRVLPSGAASTYSRSVLAATTNLDAANNLRKSSEGARHRKVRSAPTKPRGREPVSRRGNLGFPCDDKRSAPRTS
jgi:hypothetical protein